jgi:membrane-anchored protein YejM (alkaline phosphatase superfamily)
LHGSFRVARWHIFKPKITNWVNFRGSSTGRFYFIATWFIFRKFWYFKGYLVYFPRFGMLCKKNLATLGSFIEESNWQVFGV